MSDLFEIRYLSSAEEDLRDIFDYIQQDNPSAPEGLLEKFDTTISHLAAHPYPGVLPKDFRLKQLGYRILSNANCITSQFARCGLPNPHRHTRWIWQSNGSRKMGRYFLHITYH